MSHSSQRSASRVPDMWLLVFQANDGDAAIQLDGQLLKAFVRKGTAQFHLELFDAAKKTFQVLHRTHSRFQRFASVHPCACARSYVRVQLHDYYSRDSHLILFPACIT